MLKVELSYLTQENGEHESNIVQKKTVDNAPSKHRSIGWPEGQEEGFIPVDGGRVFYHLYGKNKSGLPIVFLHGGPGGSCECFCKQAALGEKHPVVFYNQLGSSGSDFTEGTTLKQAKKMLTVEHFVNEVQTVVDYFEFNEFILVGSSWGSMLAIEYAAAKQPKGLKGVVLSGPFLNVDIWCADAKRLVKLLPPKDICGDIMDGSKMWEVIRECERSGIYTDDIRYAAINTAYSENYFSRKENAGLIGKLPSDANVTEYSIPELSIYEYMWGHSEFSCTGVLKGHDTTRLLNKIRVPILYLCGEFDCGTLEAAKYYKSLSNDAEITVIGGCAHNSSCERGNEYNAIIEGFADRVMSKTTKRKHNVCQ